MKIDFLITGIHSVPRIVTLITVSANMDAHMRLCWFLCIAQAMLTFMPDFFSKFLHV
jgi:hypothetical protein